MLKKPNPRGKKSYKVIIKHRVLSIYRKLPIIAVLGIMMSLGVWLNSDFNNLQFKITIDSNKISQNDIFAITKNNDLTSILETIRSLNWVNKVEFKRKWHSVDLHIITNKIIYNYYQNDKFVGFINQNGELFITGLEVDLGKTIIITNKDKITVSFNELSNYEKLLKPLKIKKFISNNIQTLELTNGSKIILGRQNQYQRLKQMVKHLDKFRFRENSVIDLRYKNGFVKIN
jgi:cell division septal protein FtsQ